MIDKNEEFHWETGSLSNHGQAYLKIALPLLTRIVEDSQQENPRESFAKNLAEAFSEQEIIESLEALKSLVETAEIVGTIIASVGMRRALGLEKKAAAAAATKPATVEA